VTADKSLRPLAQILAGEIARLTGFAPAVAADHAVAGDIVLRRNDKLVAGEPILMLKNREPVRTTDGAHRITVGEQAVVEGFDDRAVAEGTSTILQLITRSGDGFALPKATIDDWPHADYCGAMLDVARQDHPIEAIKKVVELCRLYKARYLQLHLTDDQGWTFPSTKYPQLGSKNLAAHGGIPPRVYTLAELRELVAFADARGVTLVPELEVPGHSGAALRSLPEIFDAIDPQSKQPVGLGCMNMSNEAIYPALDTIIGEMCDVFESSPYFHIGSDEVSSGRVSLHPGYKEFMRAHGLKNDQELADHFVREVCAIVKKHGKKAIKWEGLANTASKDVIIMAWDSHSTCATEMIAKGYTTITCPWTLEVPWEQWNMYVCNGSRLKRGDSVIGSTLVAWEQPPLTHIANLRKLGSRQERTWGPDNRVTEAGFAWRFQPLDAVAGKLIDLPVKPRMPATFSSSMGQSDFLEPAFTFDANDETYYRSRVAPKTGDQFTVTLDAPALVHDLEILTGQNGRGLGDGAEVQVSADGERFTTIASLSHGAAGATLIEGTPAESRVKAIRLRAAADQTEPLVVREIRMHQLIELAGRVRNAATTIGAANVGMVAADATLAYPLGECAAPIINRGFKLTFDNEGNSAAYTGAITGTGAVEIVAADRSGRGRRAALVLGGVSPNTMKGAWHINRGAAILAKPDRVDAMAGTVEVGSSAAPGAIVLRANEQINDNAQVQLHTSARGGSQFDLAGFDETIGRLTLDRQCTVKTGDSKAAGALVVGQMTVDGKAVPRGVYGRGESWVEGNGYVVVGDSAKVQVAGILEAPNESIGASHLAVLTGPATLHLPKGEFTTAIETKNFALTLVAKEGANIRGLIAGSGSLRIEAPPAGETAERPVVMDGDTTNTYRGPTTLARGVLRLAKSTGRVAIPGDLSFGGSAPENRGDRVVWAADGQISAKATITVSGTQPALLDLGPHHANVASVVLSKTGMIRTAAGGTLSTLQLWIDGKRLADGVYQRPQPWLEGAGQVVVDARIDVAGDYGNPDSEIGRGNLGNMTGDVRLAYPMSSTTVDFINHGHRLVLDSGDGNGFAYLGSISGNGEVQFFMGPSYTGYRDAPMHLGGDRPNTMQGVFRVRKGRVQLEKPPGVDAISADVVVGGQGFNDCLFWKNSHQVNDAANITLIAAGNNGAATLHLNGCDEAAASLTMTNRNKVITDSAAGRAGTLTVKSLKVDGADRPAGAYTSATEKWIEGAGKVIVSP
jgi:hexosaminidase